MIILRLKENRYNLISDIKYSGIKRAYKKQVGRIKRKIGDNLSKSIEKDLNRSNKAESILANYNKSEIIPKDLENLAKKYKISVTKDPNLSTLEGYTSTKKIIQETNKIPHTNNTYRAQIIVSGKSPSTYAHELGHGIRSIKTPKKYNRGIKSLDSISGLVNDISSGVPVNLKNQDIKGLYLHSKNIQQEEAAANKIGIKLLKKSNIPKEAISRTKLLYKLNKINNKKYNTPWKAALRQKIQNKKYIKPGQPKTTSYIDDLIRLNTRR